MIPRRFCGGLRGMRPDRLAAGFDAVIATGGETMAAILDRLGISRFVSSASWSQAFRSAAPNGRRAQSLHRHEGGRVRLTLDTLMPRARAAARTAFTKGCSMTAHDAPLAVTMGDPSGIGPEIIAKMYLPSPGQARTGSSSVIRW